MEGVVICSANYVPLSPISFLERAAAIFRERTSIIYGSVMYTWKDTYDRCRRLASALKQMGISRGDVVAVMAPNVPAMYELHFGVPMAGAILSTLNTRYDSSMVSVLLMQSEAKIIFVDYQFLEIVRETLHLLSQKKTKLPILVLISELDPSMPTTRSASTSLVHFEYESLLRTAKVEFEFQSPADECEPISISYTSETTANPKGVVYSHRGAFLNAIATVLLIEMRSMPVFLWTVPMFHCNGWCLSWGVAAQGGTNICLRNVTPEVIFDCITLHKVTHMGGAPTILNMIVNAQIGGDQVPLPNKVVVITGGAAPPPSVLFNIEKKGFVVIHAYGMTETYGAGAVCTWMPEWDSLPGNEQAKLKSRQGLHHLGMADLDVKDPITMKSVQSDGKTIGEVMFRGNTVMSGYFKDLKATQDSMGGGWFRTRDLAVKHPDGYIEVKDWTKDIIISGGENISSIDVESVLFSHPAILEVAVVGRPDDRWGESVCAFVKLKDGCDACAEEIVGFCRDRLPHYMAPWTVVFEDLLKTSTGKTQKFVLREKAKAMGSL